MKRTLSAVLALMLLLTGCGSKQKTSPTPAEEPATEELTTVTETAPPRPIAQRAASLQAAGDTYIFDEIGVLTDEEKTRYNDYLGWLCSSRQIRAAAVLTDTLGGAEPEIFAENYFRTLFGAGESGFLVLINNDTNRDCIYRAGSCAALLPDPAAVIARATPCLVEQQYADALEILLPVGEALSEHIFDRSGVLTAEQVRTLDGLAAASEQKRCVLLLNDLPGESVPDTTDPPTEEEPEPESASEELNAPEETEEPAAQEPVSDALKAYAEEICKSAEAEELLVIHTGSKTAWIAGGEDVPEAVQSALGSAGIYEAAEAFFS